MREKPKLPSARKVGERLQVWPTVAVCTSTEVAVVPAAYTARPVPSGFPVFGSKTIPCCNWTAGPRTPCPFDVGTMIGEVWVHWSFESLCRHWLTWAPRYLLKSPVRISLDGTA